MDLDAYQKAIIKFDLNEKIESQNEVDFAFVDKVLGLSGEAGEVVDKVKKLSATKRESYQSMIKRPSVRSLVIFFGM